MINCELDDQLKHVCFKDLQGYLTEKNLLSVLSRMPQIALQQLKKILNIPDKVVVDKYLDRQSINPVENKTVTCALGNKVDSADLADVATTGSYEDLSCKPTALPNPKGLVFKFKDGKYKVYDGQDAILINIPWASDDNSPEIKSQNI